MIVLSVNCFKAYNFLFFLVFTSVLHLRDAKIPRKKIHHYELLTPENFPEMCSTSTLLPATCFLPQPNTNFLSLRSVSIPLKKSKALNFSANLQKSSSFVLHAFGDFRNSISNSSSQADSDGRAVEGDFVTRVLRENPSQVEPKFLVGNKLYTLKEKENLNKSFDVRISEILKRLNLKALVKEQKKNVDDQVENDVSSGPVYLKDILKEYKGKLYVPEQIFGVNLSEEEEFDRNLEELPKMSFSDFQKAMKSNKIKLLTSKEVSAVSHGYRDFIVDLKEIPGDKKLHRTKW